MTDTEQRERLHREVRSANVFAPSVSPHERIRCRAFVTDRRVVVWAVDDLGGEPGVWIDSPIVGEPPPATLASLFGELAVETEVGRVVIARGEGCNCRSPLALVEPPAAR